VACIGNGHGLYYFVPGPADAPHHVGSRNRRLCVVFREDLAGVLDAPALVEHEKTLTGVSPSVSAFLRRIDDDERLSAEWGRRPVTRFVIAEAIRF
jgi:hypothetical protein